MYTLKNKRIKFLDKYIERPFHIYMDKIIFNMTPWSETITDNIKRSEKIKIKCLFTSNIP